MMNQPPLDEIAKKADSRYTLVVAVAKRARQILNGEPARVEISSVKPVTVALHEIASEEIVWERTKEGIK